MQTHNKGITLTKKELWIDAVLLVLITAIIVFLVVQYPVTKMCLSQNLMSRDNDRQTLYDLVQTCEGKGGFLRLVNVSWKSPLELNYKVECS